MARLVSVALLAIFGISAVSAQTQFCTVNGNRVGYDSNAYNCLTDSQGKTQICIKGQLNCGLACFNPNTYCCDTTGSLQLAGNAKCAAKTATTSAVPATSATTSSTKASTQTTSSTKASTTTSAAPTTSNPRSSTSTVNTPTTSAGPSTCNGQLFGSGYVCAVNDQGQQKLCPSTASNACGNACYSSSVYCCDSGSALKPLGQCKNNADNGGRPTTSTSAKVTSAQPTSQQATTSAQQTSKTTQATSSTTKASTPATTSGNSNNNTGTGSGICGTLSYDPCSATCSVINGQYQITGKLVTFV